MDISNLLDDIIDNIRPENVPSEYIIMAKITDENGYETIIRGSELDEFLRNTTVNIIELQYVLNIKKIRLAILKATKAFFDDVDEMVDRDLKK